NYICIFVQFFCVNYYGKSSLILSDPLIIPLIYTVRALADISYKLITVFGICKDLANVQIEQLLFVVSQGITGSWIGIDDLIITVSNEYKIMGTQKSYAVNIFIHINT